MLRIPRKEATRLRTTLNSVGGLQLLTGGGIWNVASKLFERNGEKLSKTN